MKRKRRALTAAEILWKNFLQGHFAKELIQPISTPVQNFTPLHQTPEQTRFMRPGPDRKVPDNPSPADPGRPYIAP
jgi:hypothetical protein